MLIDAIAAGKCAYAALMGGTEAQVTLQAAQLAVAAAAGVVVPPASEDVRLHRMVCGASESLHPRPGGTPNLVDRGIHGEDARKGRVP